MRAFSEDHRTFVEAKITKMVSVTQEDNLARRWLQKSSCSMAVCTSEHSLCSAVMGTGMLLGPIAWPTRCAVSTSLYHISSSDFQPSLPIQVDHPPVQVYLPTRRAGC